MDLDELIKRLNNYNKNEILPTLNDSEERLLTSYTDARLYKIITKYQLNGEVISSKETIEHNISTIERIIAGSRLPESIEVYHGGIINLTINDKIFHQKTFLSTSLTFDIAKQFANTRRVEQYVMNFNFHKPKKLMKTTILKISLPKNFSALWLRPFSYLKKENEILLPSTGDYVLDSIDEDEKLKVIHLTPIVK